MSTRILAQSLTLPCGAILPNRIAKAAMTEGLASPAGVPTPELEKLYGLWSDGGAGLLLSGNIIIDGAHLERPGNVVIEREPDAAMHAALVTLGTSSHPQRQSLLGADQPRWQADAEKYQSPSKSAVSRAGRPARRSVRPACCTDCA